MQVDMCPLCLAYISGLTKAHWLEVQVLSLETTGISISLRSTAGNKMLQKIQRLRRPAKSQLHPITLMSYTIDSCRGSTVQATSVLSPVLSERSYCCSTTNGFDPLFILQPSLCNISSRCTETETVFYNALHVKVACSYMSDPKDPFHMITSINIQEVELQVASDAGEVNQLPTGPLPP